MTKDEYLVNLEAIRTAMPGKKVLNKKEMAEYLGVSYRGLKHFQISGPLTVESFRWRLSERRDK